MRPALAGLVLASSAWLLACPGPAPGPCFNAPSSAPAPSIPFGVVGRELRFEVTAPLLACATDTVRVDVEAFDEANARVTATAGNLRVQSGAVTTTVSLTPATPGVHSVRLYFDPSLGLVQLPVVVGVAAAVSPITERFPEVMSSCIEGPKRTRRGAVLCQRGPTVVVYRYGNVEARFDGLALVVTGDVAWSVSPTGVLERRVDGDGGLTLDGELPGFTRDTVGVTALGEHTEVLALRETVNGLRQVRFDGGALALGGGVPRPAPAGTFHVAQGEAVWGVEALGRLTRLDLGAALELPGPVAGVDHDAVWTWALATLSATRRPFDAAAPVAPLRTIVPDGFAVRPVDLSAQFAATVPAVVVPTSGAGELLLPRLGPGGIVFEAFPGVTGTVFLSEGWIIAFDADPHTLRFWRRDESSP